jgi:hypothetical protein
MPTFDELLQKSMSRPDPNARRQALAKLYRAVSESAVPVTEIGPLLQGIKAEADVACRGHLWLIAQSAPADETLRAVAMREAENMQSSHRGYALAYLFAHYPSQTEQLIRRFEGDSNPNVLFEVGKAKLPLDPPVAVELWIRALDFHPSHGLAETIFEWISEYADNSLINKFIERDREAGGGTQYHVLAGLIAGWYGLDYTEAKGPVSVLGQGYWVTCPNCDTEHGAREGHVGERVRCRSCSHVFRLPPKEEE